MSVKWPDEDVYQRTIQLSVVAGAALSGHRIVSPNEIGQMKYASSATLVDKNGPLDHLRKVLSHTGPLRTDALTRSVRTAGIGVEATDVYTISVRGTIQDNS